MKKSKIALITSLSLVCAAAGAFALAGTQNMRANAGAETTGTVLFDGTNNPLVINESGCEATTSTGGLMFYTFHLNGSTDVSYGGDSGVITFTWTSGARPSMSTSFLSLTKLSISTNFAADDYITVQYYSAETRGYAEDDIYGPDVTKTFDQPTKWVGLYFHPKQNVTNTIYSIYFEYDIATCR